MHSDKRSALDEVSSNTASSVVRDDEGAAKANAEMDRRFNGRTEDESPAEAVDVAEVFRNQS
jgi:hypothetical protein